MVVAVVAHARRIKSACGCSGKSGMAQTLRTHVSTAAAHDAQTRRLRAGQPCPVSAVRIGRCVRVRCAFWRVRVAGWQGGKGEAGQCVPACAAQCTGMHGDALGCSGRC